MVAGAREQFGRQAAHYGRDAIFAQGSTLELALAHLGDGPWETALDVATGAGHMALRLAARARRVIGLDPVPAMLDEARRGAAAGEGGNVEWVEGWAEELPFANGSFDLVTCRIAAHHFSDARRAVREMARVLRRGGRALVIDTCAPAENDLDTFLNRLEAVRDPSHRRDYKVAEWFSFFAAANLRLSHWEFGLLERRMDFAGWVKRAGTPPERVDELRRMLAGAPAPVVAALGLETSRRDGESTFAIPMGLFVATKGTPFEEP